MTEAFEPYPMDKYPLNFLQGEALASRLQAKRYREAAVREDAHAEAFEAEVARRKAREATSPHH